MKYVLIASVFGAVVAVVACSSEQPIGEKGVDTPTTNIADGGGGDGGSILPPNDGPLHVGGTRIKARHYEPTDGSSSTSWFSGWFDTQVGMGCSFFEAADGKLRCLPWDSYVTAYFDDAGCAGNKILIARRDQNVCGSPKYALEQDTTQCPSRRHIYTIGAKLAQPRTLYSKPTGACVKTVVTPSDKVVLYEVGAEISPTTFVGATEQPAAGRPDLGGVTAMDVVADDGARGFTRFVDVARNQSCAFMKTTDGSYRCLVGGDAQVYTSSLYSNDGCTAPAAVRYHSACPAPKYVVASTRDTTDGCELTWKTHNLGGGSSAYRKASDGACVPQAPDQSAKYYSMGSEIPSTSFLEAQLRPSMSTARLKTTDFQLAGGAGGERMTYPSFLFDAQTSERCDLQRAGDGIMRCLPRPRAGFTGDFADSSCEKPLVYAGDTGSLTCNAPITTAATYDATTCPMVMHIHSVGARAEGLAQIYGKKLDTGECVSTGVQGTSVFYLLGAEQPPSTFPAVGEVDH